jgi:L-fuculose-phosphate aldolase
MTEDTYRKMLVEMCVKLYDRGLTVSAGGNMSLRLDERHILITPSGRNKGMILPEDIVKVTMSGKTVGPGRPSIETGMHLALYKKNKDTNVIVHCHPLHCTVLALRGEKIRSDMTPEGVILLRDVPMVGYFTPGTPELVKAVAGHSDSAAMLMERHGAITQGRTAEEAYNRMEELEFQARLQITAGYVPGLPKDEMDRILGVLK